MIESITRINSASNNVVWGWPALILLGFVGVLMTCLTKFFQLSHIGHWMKNTIGAIFKDKHVTGHTKDRTTSGTVWAQRRAAKPSALCWRLCSLSSACWPPLASAT